MVMKNSKNQEEVIKVFTNFLTKHNHRKTPERYSILNEIYSIDGHFDIDFLYEEMNKKNTELVGQLCIILLNFYLKVDWLESISLEILSLSMKNLILIVNMII